MKILRVIFPVSVLMAATFLTACGQLQPQKHTIKGQLVVPDFASSTAEYWNQQVGKPCAGATSDVPYIQKRYRDINPGTQVVVKSSLGEIVGVGKLEQGKLDGKEPDQITPVILKMSCHFPFEVKNLPRSNFYTVEIGNRDTRLTFPIRELEQKDWQVTLTLN